ncbi:MAG: heavy-metal-associated domain-containing protein [Chthonomonadaceae bacterium]|nr:heavy-metal-associated domain-containing protein [Chthonomonadaceae bacterium]
MMQITKFHTPDIECDGCANSIKKALGKVLGVETVEVDVPTKTVSVFHEVETTEAMLAQILDKAGFPVSAS